MSNDDKVSYFSGATTHKWAPDQFLDRVRDDMDVDDVTGIIVIVQNKHGLPVFHRHSAGLVEALALCELGRYHVVNQMIKERGETNAKPTTEPEKD